MSRSQLPDGLEHVRTTDVCDNSTVPVGLLRSHRVADGVWGSAPRVAAASCNGRR